MRCHLVVFVLWGFLKKNIFLVTKHPPGSLQVVNSMCARVRVMFWKSAIPLTNEGCWFSFCSGLLFRRQLSPRCSLRVSLKRRDWEIIWENALCGLSTLVGLRFIQLSYGKACPPPPPPIHSLSSLALFFPFFLLFLWFGPGNLFNTESTKATASWLTLYVKVDTEKRGSVAD